MPLPVVGDAGKVTLGPGGLYVATLGTAEPVSGSVALNAAFREVGWTESGSEFQYSLTTADILVAEVFDPIKVATTARKATVTFEMAQMQRNNLALAINAATMSATDNGAQGLAPPAVGSENRVIIVWEGQNGSRWVYRRCIQGAPITIKRDKAPAKATMPTTFQLEIPATAAGSVPPGSTGFEPFWVFPDANGVVD